MLTTMNANLFFARFPSPIVFLFNSNFVQNFILFAFCVHYCRHSLIFHFISFNSISNLWSTRIFPRMHEYIRFDVVCLPIENFQSNQQNIILSECRAKNNEEKKRMLWEKSPTNRKPGEWCDGLFEKQLEFPGRTAGSGTDSVGMLIGDCWRGQWKGTI